jgi:hypothetical protein
VAYLLAAQALVDSALNRRSDIHRWAEATGVGEGEVVTSVMSFSSFRYLVSQLDAGERPAWERLFRSSLARFRGDNTVDVSLEIALRAAQLRALDLHDEDDEPIGEIALLEIATALEEHLTLIDRRQPCHALLEAQHGLQFHDPYDHA